MKSDFWRVWTIPLVLAGLSAIGLLAALLGDGVLDAVSWVSLIVPLLVIGWFVAKSKTSTRGRHRH